MRAIHKRLGDRVAANIGFLYAAYLANYIAPLVTIPYLTRVLGPAAWGLVAMAQGLGNYLNAGVEYGFNYSATREVSQRRDSPEYLSGLLAGVLGAKLMLAAIGAALGLVLMAAIPALHGHPAVLWSGVAAGIAIGLNPLWYFQGRERMPVVALLEVFTKFAAAGGVFILVRRPEHAWRVLALQAAASVLSTGIGLVLAYRDVPPRLPTPALVKAALTSGWGMFLFRSSAMLYTAGNAFLLGLFAPPLFAGYFAGAEKISKAMMGLLNPINQALYPRLSSLLHHSPRDASRLVRANAALVAGGGIALGAVIFAGAPFLVGRLLGPALMPAVPALRLLAALPVVIGLNTVLCTQWMAQLGMESVLNRIVLSAGLLNLLLAAALAPRYRHIGMAVAVLGAELFVGVACCVVLFRRPRAGCAAALDAGALTTPGGAA